MTNTGWQDSANCASVGWELFYDGEDNSSALKVCRACLVRIECRAYIDAGELEPFDVHGVAAGQTAAQRINRRWPLYDGGRHPLPEGELRAS